MFAGSDLSWFVHYAGRAYRLRMQQAKNMVTSERVGKCLQRWLREEAIIVAGVIFLTVLLRTLPLVWLTFTNAPEVWDAYGYSFRATGIRNIIFDWFQGLPIQSEDKLIAYSNQWPPGQAMIIAASYLVFGESLLAGRLAMILVSAATVPIIYWLTKYLSGRTAAIAAITIFAIYPSFIHSALRLESENAFILLTLSALLLCVLVVDMKSMRGARILALLAGILLGLSGLVRAAAVAWIPVLILWVAWRAKSASARIVLPSIIVFGCLICLLPWEAVLHQQEGRIVTIATSGEENLYRGNNPWIPNGAGSNDHMWNSLRAVGIEYAQEHGISDKQAFRELAIQEIRDRPAEFLARGPYKLRDMVTPDSDLIHWVLWAIYPPVSEPLAAVVILLAIISLPILGVLVAGGLLVEQPTLRHRILFLILVLSYSAVIFITYGENSRFLLPLLAVLLPLAGHGVAHIGQLVSDSPLKRVGLVSIVTLFFIYASVVNLARFYQELESNAVSGNYTSIVRSIDRVLGGQTLVADRILLRRTEARDLDTLQVRLSTPDYRFDNLSSLSYTWLPSLDSNTLNLVASSASATSELQLIVTCDQCEVESVTITPASSAWHSWMPTGIEGVEYMWVGSTSFPAKSSLGRTVAKDVGDWEELLIPSRDELAWGFKRYD